MYNTFQHDDDQLVKLMMEKRFHKLIKTKDFDVLAIEQIFDSKYYWYTVDCLSTRNEVFRIKKEVGLYNNCNILLNILLIILMI